MQILKVTNLINDFYGQDQYSSKKLLSFYFRVTLQVNTRLTKITGTSIQVIFELSTLINMTHYKINFVTEKRDKDLCQNPSTP